jgi:hypothetical protein
MLAPDVDLVQGELGALYAAHGSLTAAALAFRNMTLTAPAQPASWFAGLAQSLQAAQSLAEGWLETDGPACVTGLTQPFDAYKVKFATASGELLAADQAAVVARLQWLQTHLKEQSATATALEDKMIQTAAGLRATVPAMQAAVDAARKALRADEAQIQAVEAEISGLLADIGDANVDASNAMRSMGEKGASKIGEIMMISVMTAIGTSMEFPIVGSVVAVVALVYDGVKEAQTLAAIQDKLGRIRDLAKALTADLQQAAALSSLIHSVEATARLAANAQARTTIHGLWNEIGCGVDMAIERLSAPGVTLAAFNERSHLTQYGSDWAAIDAAALSIQASALGLGAGPSGAKAIRRIAAR